MIEKVKEEVSKLLNGDTSGHGMEHINRVLALSLKFAEKEKGDKEIISLIALLHDVDDYKLVGVDNARDLTNAKRIMALCNVSQKEQEQVCLAIKTIGYGKRVEGLVPESIEAKIVSDADMCDTLGSTGLLRIFTYGQKHQVPFFLKDVWPCLDMTADKYKTVLESSSVCHIFEKILKLKDLMLTDEGKKEAQKRHQIIVDFLYHFFEEENAPKWTEYLNKYLENK